MAKLNLHLPIPISIFNIVIEEEGIVLIQFE